MFMGMYQFDGDPSELTAAYDRLIAGFPPGMIELQLCVVRTDGITVLDTCPAREVFDEFSTSTGFADALAAAGLPVPIVEPLGDVHHVIGPPAPTA